MEIEANNRLGEVLRMRDMAGKDLATAIGVTEHTVSRWVQRKHQPDVLNLIKIARALNVLPSDIIPDLQEPMQIWVSATEEGVAVRAIIDRGHLPHGFRPEMPHSTEEIGEVITDAKEVERLARLHQRVRVYWGGGTRMISLVPLER